MLCIALLFSAASVVLAAERQQPWAYAEVRDMGPSKWKDVRGSNGEVLYPDCALTKQSPINLFDAAINPKLVKINFNYNTTRTADYRVENTQHSQNITFTTSPGKIIDGNQGGKRFTLQHLHFHSPSEHSIGGGLYDMELHLVHTADPADEQPDSAVSYKSKYLVVGILFSSGTAHNSVLNRFWRNLPDLPLKDFAHYSNPFTAFDSTKVDGTDPFAITNLLPASPAYYTYDGSFTTPPCTEGVKWYVMHEVLHISTEQLAAFRKSMGFAEEKAHVETTFIHTFPPFELFGNNRPVQPLNSRKIESFVEVRHQGRVVVDDDDDQAMLLGILGTVFGATALALMAAYIVISSIAHKKSSAPPDPDQAIKMHKVEE